jgi:predicted TIM-barrel fold metal-dependent hydrolase
MNQAVTLEYGVPSALHGIKIVDSDTHISEWEDLWTSRASPQLRERVPQQKLVDGNWKWVIDGHRSLGAAFPMCVVGNDGAKANGHEFLKWRLSDATPAAHDVKARLTYMDEAGITAQIAYPNLLGFSGHEAARADEELRIISIKIYNDAMAEFQEQSGNRIFPMILLPWWNVVDSVAEARRCAAMGMRGININPDPHSQGLPELGDRHWYPLWEACVDLDLPVNFHIGTSDDSVSLFGKRAWPKHAFAAQLAFGSLTMFMENMQVLANILLSGFLEDFPTLRIVSVESGIGWLPFALEGLEYQMRESGIRYKTRPIDVFRRQIYGSFWFERANVVATSRQLGIDNVMFQTDFPHPTCLHPAALSHCAEVAASYTADERRKVFGDNARRVYKLPI